MQSFPALVLRQTDYGENDKLLTLLSAEHGRMTVNIKGGKSLKNKNAACAQLLCYSEFTVKEHHSYYTLSESSLIEQFFGLRAHLDRFALAQYVAEVVSEVAVANEEASELLSLTLNTLYMLAETDKDADLIKAVFELRLLAISGFCPDLTACRVCGAESHDRMYLDVMNGSLRCGECFGSDADASTRREDEGTATVILPLSMTVLGAMRYVTTCPPKRIFSFTLPEEEKDLFCRTCEKYLLHQLEKSFKTLSFYESVRSLGGTEKKGSTS